MTKEICKFLPYVTSEGYCSIVDCDCENNESCYLYSPVTTVEKQYCRFCFNSRIYQPAVDELIDPHITPLTDENDFSSRSVGEIHPKDNKRSIMINSGGGKPLTIEFREWFDYSKCWITVGEYYPKYCPECGRKLNEYEESKSN